MFKDLFLEIGCEEIPAGSIPKAMADMELLMKRELEGARLDFGEIVTLGTPRRLVLAVKALAQRQPDAVLTAMGPAKSVAFDGEGNPTRAAEGFARGQGVDVDALSLVTTEKGEYLAAVKSETGRASAELLTEILPRLLGNIPFRKSMRWGDLEVRFVRPIHWIVALFDGAVVPFSFGNIEAGNASRGHRFMADTAFTVRGLDHYLEQCEEHFVIPDPARRKEIIRREIARVAELAGGLVLPDEGLLEQVTFLVEYPSAVAGTFSPDFLAVPREVLITSMREHQRYFSLVDAAGKLLPGFITINNTLTGEPGVVIKGNERVLRARLSDARFFFEEDKKIPLAVRVESLKNVVYQAKLGTSYEKMERFRALAEWISEKVRPGVRPQVSRAAFLCKADLTTGMVGEFPEVQGVMGCEYALLEGEADVVAQAIREHYLPIQAGGELPASDVGAIVSIADKLDTVCGCFGVGLIPTGTADPYALRRCALGIINIIVEKKYLLLLSALVPASLERLEAKLARDRDEVLRDVLAFFEGRFVNLMAGRYPADVVDAVVAVSCDDLVDACARIRALSEFRNRSDFGPLAVTFKRVCNIVKDGVDTPVSAALFDDPAEEALHQALLSVSEQVALAVASGDYLAALSEIAALKGCVDHFFEKVLVMARDERVRCNRLALLTGIARLFARVADFSRLSS